MSYTNGPKYTVERGPPPGRISDEDKYTVRQWDMFDGWFDIKADLSWADAVALWLEQTKNGTRNTKYNDGDYYDIFPAGTRMIYTPETLGR
jgi:hypothetical protein